MIRTIGWTATISLSAAAAAAVGLTTAGQAPRSALAAPAGHAVANPDPASARALHMTVEVGGLNIFYREAGPKDAPTILLLHGFPTALAP